LLSVFGGLAVSGAAFAALATMQGQPARADTLASIHVVQVSETALRPRAKTGVTASGEAKTAVPADPAKVAAGSAAVAGQGAVLVPDFVGKRYAVARREAKALGIKVSARDDYGERVPASVAHLYRVTSQSVAAGSSLPAGGQLAFQVREPVTGYSMGY